MHKNVNSFREGVHTTHSIPYHPYKKFVAKQSKLSSK